MPEDRYLTDFVYFFNIYENMLDKFFYSLYNNMVKF